MLKFVHQRKEELVARGSSQDCALFEVHDAVLRPTDEEVVSLLQARSECNEEIARRENKGVFAKQAHKYFHNVYKLFTAVRRHIEVCLQVSFVVLFDYLLGCCVDVVLISYAAAREFEHSRMVGGYQATCALSNYIPMLTTSLRLYYRIHSKKTILTQTSARKCKSSSTSIWICLGIPPHCGKKNWGSNFMNSKVSSRS